MRAEMNIVLGKNANHKPSGLCNRLIVVVRQALIENKFLYVVHKILKIDNFNSKV